MHPETYRFLLASEGQGERGILASASRIVQIPPCVGMTGRKRNLSLCIQNRTDSSLRRSDREKNGTAGGMKD
ncbi:MAG: hypothetical protein NW226_11190 [Microscillaceae bacterium]|nr:hypothetical protein [Microscillaceae bacterium]